MKKQKKPPNRKKTFVHLKERERDVVVEEVYVMAMRRLRSKWDELEAQINNRFSDDLKTWRKQARFAGENPVEAMISALEELKQKNK